ncbi:S-layer homology domain-containing protein [Calidithermus roseus]|uniref:S-layer protein SlpA n=1 Tax=Calidithermus roseus TaxID=1644118 RepID=A0A399EN73_9DEIN|nr:S-layer homology domain-containing protein [Calidithermus roseus]RIH86067.1 S-layer protein SlpA [Calidithermus roseus]
MRKKLVIMLAGLLTVLSMGFGAAQFSDVPAGHWAQEAVEAITARGIIVGFPDGTFRGNENLTRYQAALIIYRLLQQLEAEKGAGPATEAVTAMTEEEKAALQNAIQELAAELAALGVRVSALEDNAATKDDIAALQAQIDELKAAQAPTGEAVDQQALQDLADRVEAASVAADTALAQAQELGERLDTVEGDVAALKSEVEANADSISALNELAVLLNQDVLSLQDRVTAVEKALADIQAQPAVDLSQYATLEDVAALQEFASALRTDLVALSEKVSALETTVAGLDKRVAALEGYKFTLTGNLTARYGYSYTTGANYDIERLYSNVWGDYTWDADDDGQTIDNPDFFSGGDTRARAILTFSVKRTPVGTGSGFNLDEARAQLRFTQDGAVRLEDNAIQVLLVNLTGNIDGQPFTLRYSRFNDFKFTDYFMSNADPNYTGGLGRGARVTFEANKFFLSPKVTVVMGSTANNSGTGFGGDPSAVNDYFGVRSVYSLLGLNVGLNYAEYNTRNTDGTGRAGFAVDWNGKLLGFLNLKGEYVATKLTSLPNWDFSNDAIVDQAFYVQPSVSFGPITVEANYRAIDPDFKESGYNANNAGLSIDFQTNRDNKRPYDENERGYGVKATLGLGFVTISGLYDHDANFYEDASSVVNSLGADATASLFAGFSVTGYFYNATDISGNLLTGSDRFDSKYGVKLSHDGKASNALIKGLNLGVEYRQIETGAAGDYDRGDILVNADLDAKFGPIAVKPGVFFDAASGSASGSALKFGLQVTTDTLNLGFLKPNLTGAYVTRNSTIGSTRGETYYSFGLGLADFLASGAKLNVTYASYSGSGLSSASAAAGVENHLFDYTTGYIYSDDTTAPVINFELRGLYVNYTYGGFGVFAHWGDLVNSTAGTQTPSYGFRISYSYSF